MQTSRQVLSVVMAVALVASAGVVVGARQAAAEPTEIDSCTVIDESGEYVLTRDVARNGTAGDAPMPCIEIRASDVTLDGDGYAVRTDGDTSDAERTGISVGANSTLHNVSLRDVTVGGEGGDNVRYEGVVGGQLVNVTSSESGGTTSGVVVADSRAVRIRNSTFSTDSSFGNGIVLSRSEGVSVVNNTFTDVSTEGGISLDRTNESTIRGNEFDGGPAVKVESGSDNLVAGNSVDARSSFEGVIQVGGHDNVVRDNSIDALEDGIQVRGDNNTIEGNHVEAYPIAVELSGTNHTVTNNDLWAGDVSSYEGGAVFVEGGGHEIAHNRLGFGHGVSISDPTATISIHHNYIDAFYDVKVVEHDEQRLCGPDSKGADAVELHYNTFEPWDRLGAANGVWNDGANGTLDATHNYWGTANGPADLTGANVSDPVTGEPADGSGSSVSEGVRFDPWLDRPANGTRSSESSD
ncbi:right-handed parallel beta-helix repeat-containing protein [Halorarum halophilum]|uniref:Right-handed parallel beta-helix repeat-containing protein n=1 Tax=Halorarum halophilum TaxID=2743090 RepID=A0A7D5GFY6_9EURY|nr:right-handed parallel beta-helix repeat-containing protein [Halobaculum halophilum]QLG28628.1 right-handed parallel beta-helix repeat-containing protein [Halobaculum halophilum]